MKQKHEELPLEDVGSIVKTYHIIIRWFVKFLALLMTIIIFISLLDVGYEIVTSIIQAEQFIPRQKDIFALFGAAMTTLIAIEIFINVRIYLGSNEMPVKLVIATALMALARKCIILDFDSISPWHLLSLGVTIFALGAIYICMKKLSL